MNEVSVVILGFVAMLTMALGVIIFVVMYQQRVIKGQKALKALEEQKNVELIKASIRSEEEERKRIAGELHDDIGATLSTASLYIASAINDNSEVSMQQTKKLVDLSIQKLRAISQKLQPAMLSYLGLESSLQSLVKMINESKNIKVSFQSDLHLSRYSDMVELHTYRIIQELLTNIQRHANATEIDLSILEQDNELKTTLIHNGKGMTQTEFDVQIFKSGSLGLKNLINRLSLLKGTIIYNKLENSDKYEVHVNIPIQNPEP